ncbi:STAS/SEC14 domain-containing protein [Virgibacillus proomii]|uniref:STAS/SEC14 domain-containing protein n=1 Tax=Virgibacillus proomii TaxID=84407 RepID=UPI0009870F69|nr:STAS/SEC14 domain-containing protein [Virgibacillus proomii]
MIKMKSAPFDNVLKVEIQEKVTGEDIHQFKEFFMMKRQQHSKVTILLVMDEMQGVTLNGIKEEFKLGKYVKDINKIAMVSDEKWIKKSLKLESLIPEIEIEHFPIKNKSQAEHWLVI